MVDTNKYQIGFVIEQALGHITHGKNLQENVRHEPAINAHWILPAWQPSGWSAGLPLYNNWTLRAGWGARRGLARLDRQQPLDALFFHTQVPAVLAQDWLRRIPSLVSLDATPLQYDELGSHYGHDTSPALVERLKWQLNRRTFLAAAHLVTWSAWARDGLVDGYGIAAEKISVIPPGVNVEMWARSEPRPPVASRPLRILFVGGNLERKGGTLLLDVFRQLSGESGEAGNHCELHMVTRDEVAEEAGVHVYNQMEPNSRELRQLYHDCDIFCLPTQGDALPMVLSEAAAAGLPLISTRVAAVPEIVHHEETGLLIEPGDGRGLASALRSLRANPERRQQFGERGTSLVRQQFDARRNAEQVMKLLTELIKTFRTEARRAPLESTYR